MQPATSLDFQSLYILCEKGQKDNEELRKDNQELKGEVLKLQQYLQKALQVAYGGKSERFIPNPGQLVLDITAETPAPSSDLSKAKKIE